MKPSWSNLCSVQLKMTLKKCTIQHLPIRICFICLFSNRSPIYYRREKVKIVQLAKVTLVRNSHHLACHLTCTFMFAPCPANLLLYRHCRPFLISRRRFQDGLMVGHWSYRARYEWLESFEKHMVSKADAILKSWGCLLIEGKLSWADAFWILI